MTGNLAPRALAAAAGNEAQPRTYTITAQAPFDATVETVAGEPFATNGHNNASVNAVVIVFGSEFNSLSLSVDLEGSNDLATWAVLATLSPSGVGSSSIDETDITVPYLRFRCSAFVEAGDTGVVIVTLGCRLSLQ